jgi:hypothetical protein
MGFAYLRYKVHGHGFKKNLQKRAGDLVSAHGPTSVQISETAFLAIHDADA